MRRLSPPTGAAWAVETEHPAIGPYFLYGRTAARLLFTENETNAERLWGAGNASPYVKDAFHRRVIAGEVAAVNPEERGSKVAAWYEFTVDAGSSETIELVLSSEPLLEPFADTARI